MVLVDINKILQRIQSRIENYSDLFDPNNPDGKLRKVRFGDPEYNLEKLESMIPYCYVTTSDAIQGINYGFGVSANNILNYTIMEFHLTIVARSLSKSVEAQKSVYDFIKFMRTMLEEDPTIPDPLTDNSPPKLPFWALIEKWNDTVEYPVGAVVVFENQVFKANAINDDTQPPNAVWNLQFYSVWINGINYQVNNVVIYNGKFFECGFDNTSNDGDPIFSRSIVADIPYNTDTRGKTIISVTLVLSGTIGSLGSITIGDLGTIQLLSEPPDQDAEDYGRHYDTFRKLQGIAPLGDFRLYFIEIEATDSSVDYFRTKKAAAERFSITVTDSSGVSTVYFVHVRLVSKGVTINSIPTAIITFEIVP